MKVLLINPNRVSPPVAPLALDSLGEALRSRGIRPRVLDLCVEASEGPGRTGELFRRAATHEPEVVLLTLRNLDDAYYFSRRSFLPGFRRLVADLKQTFRCPIVLGGSAFSIAPAAILRLLEADLGIAGAAEADLLRLLDTLTEPGLRGGLPGLVWREGERIRSNPPSPPAMEEDFFSARRLVRNDFYYRHGGMVGLETKRGCAEACRYCVDPVIKGARVFPKPLPFLVREVESLVARGIPVFHLCDSEFNLPRDHAMKVCEALQDAGLSERIRWYTYASPADFDEELAIRMAEAGCAGINFGVDHCHPEILRALGRRHGPEDLERAAGAARAAGIPFFFDLLLGGPGETRKTLREAVDFCRDLDVPRVGANCGIRVYPGTPLAHRILAGGTLEENEGLEGRLAENEDLLYPVFYVSPAMGPGWQAHLESLVEGDPRFFLPLRRKGRTDYNYNENRMLVEALEKGHKGAFWDILRRVQEGLPPLRPPETRRPEELS